MKGRAAFALPFAFCPEGWGGGVKFDFINFLC
jgi:hypothetical protein